MIVFELKREISDKELEDFYAFSGTNLTNIVDDNDIGVYDLYDLFSWLYSDVESIARDGKFFTVTVVKKELH